MGLLWTIGAWVFGVVGVGLLMWAVLWDRSRGRDRCRRCWYALEGAAGVGRGPVTCPECGAAHRRARSMRRTRRRWGWAVLAAGLLVVSYHGFERRRAVSGRGWMAGVPLPLLVLPTAWMSEKPGSVWKGDPNAASGFEFAVAAELAARETRYGRVARWMLVEIGERSAAEVITDRSTMKGAVFRTVFERLYAERALSPAQGRWARSVVWAGFETRDAWHPEASVHGVLRARTLVGGPYEVGVLNAPGRFEALGAGVGRLPAAVGAPTWLGGSGTGGGPMADPLRAQMLDAWSWDWVQPVRDAFWNGAWDGVVAMVADEFAAFEHGAGDADWFTVLFWAADADDPYVDAGRSIGQALVPVALSRDAAAAAPAIETRAGTDARLAETLRARLVPVALGPTGGDWRPAIRLEVSGRSGGEPITFGGRTSIWLQREAPSRPRMLMSGEGCWFRLEPGADGAGAVVARTRFGGALMRDASTSLPAPGPGDRLSVRLEPEQFPPHRSAFADLESDRVYLGVVEVELEDWTVEEINRLRVSGVWPDHAMRE
jgi:hypothetical protein